MPTPLPHGFYVAASKAVLTHPVITYDLEESYEFGCRNRVHVRHPFWQAELVDFLCGGESSGLTQVDRAAHARLAEILDAAEHRP